MDYYINQISDKTYGQKLIKQKYNSIISFLGCRSKIHNILLVCLPQSKRDGQHFSLQETAWEEGHDHRSLSDLLETLPPRGDSSGIGLLAVSCAATCKGSPDVNNYIYPINQTVTVKSVIRLEPWQNTTLGITSKTTVCSPQWSSSSKFQLGILAVS